MFCAIMTLILLNGQEWTLRDAREARTAAITCKRRYGTCLKSFTKKGYNDYRAICE